MEDITDKFSGCKQTTEELRNTIKNILGLDDAYFCHKCFLFLGVEYLPKNALTCEKCFQSYCERCGNTMTGTDKKINPGRCIQCYENEQFLRLSKY